MFDPLGSFKRMASHAPAALAALLLITLFQPMPQVSGFAQAGCRTFTETGKVVCGRFLQYWQQNGGLAQQGFPISSEIQETSATDGKVYTVQYFERAIFEYHPENRPPHDVLLSLLGVFLYSQKYPQGAPGATPNNERGSRLFSETGKRLGGLFLDYWQRNGGLAQQGFPISDEFTERSDLDGKTYRVQYFQRAVFEYHPENQPPHNVLLSQLGTFRYRAKFASLSHQLSGSSTTVTAPFPLKRGLAVFQGVRAYGGYFYIDVVDANGEGVATIAYGSGPRDVSSYAHIRADGMYRLDVQTEGGWTVNVAQPKAAFTPPPARQQWSGRTNQVTPLFSLKAGPARFRAVGTTSSEEFRVSLLDQDGLHVATIADTTGAADVSIEGNIPNNGVFLLEVTFEGDWTVSVEQ